MAEFWHSKIFISRVWNVCGFMSLSNGRSIIIIVVVINIFTSVPLIEGVLFIFIQRLDGRWFDLIDWGNMFSVQRWKYYELERNARVLILRSWMTYEGKIRAKIYAILLFLSTCWIDICNNCVINVNIVGKLTSGIINKL